MEKPEIITMCGSTKYSDLMAVISWEYEKIGKIVLRVNYLPEWYVKIEGWTENSHGAEQANLKKELDELHCRKIDMCDKVYVCNFDGYIGESTTNEISYAKSIGKPIIYFDGEDNEMTETMNRIVSALVKDNTGKATAILPDVSGWVSVSDKTKPMPNDRKMQIKFKEGTIMDYDAENWPWDVVTHWRPKP